MQNIDWPDVSEIRSESDVEQKILYQLITTPMPMGLGFPTQGVFTKSNIKSLPIGKGQTKKNYYPDYLFVHSGLPLLVVEAKAPGGDLEEALREARLYAAELNAKFPPTVDPTKFVLASDGIRLLAGTWNCQDAIFDLKIASCTPADQKFSEFLAEYGFGALSRWCNEALSFVRPQRYWKPRKMVGGLAAQSEEVGLNSFGNTIKSDFRGVFDPTTLDERNRIAEECYIPSRRRERYVDSIDRTFRAIIAPSERNTCPIEDTSRPDAIISKLRKGVALTNQVLLLIGAAGAGKTTFVDHLRVKALPRELRNSTRWVHINMNAAPVGKEEIYPWLRIQLAKGLRAACQNVDFDELETIRKIFKREVEAFRKGVGRLYEANQERYNEKLADELSRLLSDEHAKTQAYCEYVSGSFSALIVIVLDNCDKRLLEEQLLMFEAAQWLRSEFRAMVFLPLREETYDNNLSVPPLDTALKDLAFRIEAPRFDLILQSRIDLAIKELNQDPRRRFTYDLPNSMRVNYTAADKVSYLRSIMRSVFDANANVRRLLIGLSGRNMRRAMEIFLDFCSSGHISEDYIVKMVQSNGAYALPISLVSRVLLRSKRRYYDSDQSYVVNLFGAEIDDIRPHLFVRLMILRHLSEISPRGKGPRIRGYARVGDMFPLLAKQGAIEEVVLREVNYLASRHCIISEDFRIADISAIDLITISPAGRTHLQMLSNVHYIAAVAEDLWFRSEAAARSVAERIKDREAHFQPWTVARNARSAVAEMQAARNEDLSTYTDLFDDPEMSTLIEFIGAEKSVKEFEGEIAGRWAWVPEKFPPGRTFPGIVTNKVPYGLFVDLEPGITGLLHVSKAADLVARSQIGDEISVKVLSIDMLEKKVELSSGEQ
ncbi:S1 RNA-binding domain-containing protein [Rhodobacter sp. NSM]|uniref:S1 RNA-binding domain-containing protein n=1 Tax=Rhodobacter sp. NSM TaxID=3457501 RepID=UPI003FD502E8